MGYDHHGKWHRILGLGVLSLYFINRKNLFYTLPFVVLLFVIAQNSEIKQLSRTTKIVKATMTGNSSKIAETDISGATRIVPLLNTFRMDFKQMNTWIGHGTLAKKNRFTNAWKNLGAHDDFVLGVVYQYGWIAFLIAIGLMFQCCIYRLLSLETLLWLTLGMATLSNVYTCWGTVMMMAGVRYFQEQKRMKVSIIIVNYNTKELLDNCIESIYAQTEEVEFETIVVDNASSDGSEEFIKEKYPFIKWINSGGNVGFGKANNIGAEHAAGEFLFLLNPDTILKNNVLKLFYQHMKENANKDQLGALGCYLWTTMNLPTFRMASFLLQVGNLATCGES